MRILITGGAGYIGSTVGSACEDANGFLKVLKSTPELEQFVKGKNAERKAKYQEIAAGQSTKEKPVSADDVGKLTAAKLDHRCP